MLCNREIKFGVCLDYAQRLGAQRFATGHYARLELRADGTGACSRRAILDKDQSYFLHAVEPVHFERVLFPLGELEKSAVRALAREAGLPVFDKPDSTGICFIGERPFREFLARYIPTTPGDIVTEQGEVVGRHRGLAFYTLGQRGGLEIGGRAGNAGGCLVRGGQRPGAQPARGGSGPRPSVAGEPRAAHRAVQLAGGAAKPRRSTHKSRCVTGRQTRNVVPPYGATVRSRCTSRRRNAPSRPASSRCCTTASAAWAAASSSARLTKRLRLS